MLAMDFFNQPAQSLRHLMTIPVWDNAKGMKTPMEYKGIKRSVEPWKMTSKIMEPAASGLGQPSRRDHDTLGHKLVFIEVVGQHRKSREARIRRNG